MEFTLVIKNSQFVVTAVDYGETCDGKARVLKCCDTKEEAQQYVRSDIEKWADDRAGENIIVDFDKMNAYYKDNDNNGCEWNIEEVAFNSTFTNLKPKKENNNA